MSIFYIFIYIICWVYMILNFKYDIQMLQQNSYRISRYWRWLKNGHLMQVSRLVDIVILFLIFSNLLPVSVSISIAGLTLLYKICRIITAKFKKPLVFTNRVKRLYSLAGIIASVCYVCLIIFGRSINTYNDCPPGDNPAIPVGGLLLISIFSWLFIIVSVILIQPVENMINRRYYNDARRILKSMPDLKIIGITGSFGKTSTKHYLQTILSESYDVVITPGSFNTPMGVIRTVREIMKPYNQIFICEMGAKQKGDIKEICDLVHPSIGIITAVGPMHLETFKTIENVQSTKFELADALPSDGLAIINNDFEYCRNREVVNTDCLRYSVNADEKSDYTVKDIEYSPQGTRFHIIGNGVDLDLNTKLVGECNISNLLASVIVALHLGVPEDKIQYGVRRIEQVEHRLSVKRTPGGVTIIDDAFNSNPFGSKMALDVLGKFTGGKRIVVSPGMVELGDKQYELNKELGKHIGSNADIAIIVGNYNKESLLEGIKESGMDATNVHTADTFNDAQSLLAGILAPGDTVLYENDLPDTFK